MATSAIPSINTTQPASKKNVSYIQQINEDDEFDENTQEGYMMLLPVRKKPIIQMFFAFAAMILAIAALARDEIMDGNITFASTNYWHDKMSEVDYDCGYSQLRFTYIFSSGYQQSETYSYGSALCTEDEYIFSSNFCADQVRNGKIWLACGIIAIIFNAVSIFVVYKHGHKSLIYLALMTLSIIFYSTSAFNWLANERCSDMENYSNSSMTLDTNLGSSMVLMIVAIGLCVFGILVSLMYFLKARKRNAQANVVSSTVNTTQITAAR